MKEDDHPDQPGDGDPKSDKIAELEQQLAEAKEAATSAAKVAAELQQKVAQTDERYSNAERRMHEATQAYADLVRKSKVEDLTEEEKEKLRDDPVRVISHAKKMAAEMIEEQLEALRKDLSERDTALVSYLQEQEGRITRGFAGLDPRTKSPAYERYRKALPDVPDEQIFRLIEMDGTPSSSLSGAPPQSKPPVADDKVKAVFDGVFGGVLGKEKK